MPFDPLSSCPLRALTGNYTASPGPTLDGFLAIARCFPVFFPVRYGTGETMSAAPLSADLRRPGRHSAARLYAIHTMGYSGNAPSAVPARGSGAIDTKISTSPP